MAFHLIRGARRSGCRPVNLTPRHVILSGKAALFLAENLLEGVVANLVQKYRPTIWLTPRDGYLWTRTNWAHPDQPGRLGDGNSSQLTGEIKHEWSGYYSPKSSQWSFPLSPEVIEELVFTLDYAGRYSDDIQIAMYSNGDLSVRW